MKKAVLDIINYHIENKILTHIKRGNMHLNGHCKNIEGLNIIFDDRFNGLMMFPISEINIIEKSHFMGDDAE